MRSSHSQPRISNFNLSDIKNTQYFDPNDENIKKEILFMIAQYLDETGYRSSAQILSDEAKFTNDHSVRKEELIALKEALKNDDWAKIESLQIDKHQSPRFMYQLYKYHVIEIINSGDFNVALQFLSARLRPYKAFESPKGDFHNLCTLLVDAAGNTPIKLPSLNECREQLIGFIDNSIAEFIVPSKDLRMHPNRLYHLIQQAVSLELACYSRGVVKSIVEDFKPAILPSLPCRSLPKVHKGSIKTLSIIPNTTTLLSGGSDSSIVVWDLKQRMKQAILKGHKGRIWSIGAKGPRIAASASGDGTIRVWDLKSRDTMYVYEYGNNDVYSVDMNDQSTRLIAGGFDRSFVLVDLENGKTIFKRDEHLASITSVLFDPSGNMAVTGGKDLAIRIWDLRNAMVVRELSPILAEVTSVSADSSFSKILGATKNSSHRIWDLRMTETVTLLRGHQNQSRHFVRACFGPDDRTVLSGSDDGKLYVYGSTSGKILEVFDGHPKGSYEMTYCKQTNQFLSCGEDNSIMTWEMKGL